MKLTQVERWILANQYRILETLEPDYADSHTQIRKALESGFELAYDWDVSICPDNEVLSSKDCSEVIEILNMFRVIKAAYNALEDKQGIEPRQLEFSGFSGNDETNQFAFGLFLREQGKWNELEWGDNGNSHFEALGGYRRMMSEWRKTPDNYRYDQLSKEDLLRIVAARYLR